MRSRSASTIGRHILIQFLVAVPVVGAAVGVFAATGNIGLGIVPLLLWPPAVWFAAKYGLRVDYKRDAEGPMIRLDEDRVLLPGEEERVWPREGILAGAGYYRHLAHRFSPRTSEFHKGLFAHLRHKGENVVLLAHDGFGDAPARGIKRYKDAPRDMETVTVWSGELLKLIEALGSSARNARE